MKSSPYSVLIRIAAEACVFVGVYAFLCGEINLYKSQTCTGLFRQAQWLMLINLSRVLGMHTRG